MSDTIVSEKPLLPCPFCENAAAPELIELRDGTNTLSFHAECDYETGGCDARGPSADSTTEAIEKWNRRALSGERPAIDPWSAVRAGYLEALSEHSGTLPMKYEERVAHAEAFASSFVAARSTPSEKAP